ncbi:hypothetical protein [Streptomyces sp. NPDC097619]|uniref:hypothetical protein n=1 Tax=Streptomyces sp. NPDC097619 TaxID=3157228 RepID=UPI0033197AAD
MGSELLTLGAAFLGGLVTLGSVLLTQRSAERLRKEDLERADRHRREDRAHAQESQLLEGRRASYAAINAAGRSVRHALVTCVRELRATGRVTPETAEALETTWSAYVAQHAEAQMSVSDGVLVALGSVNGGLHHMYRLVQDLRRGVPEQEAALQELERRSEELWERLIRARDEMRRDLGITSVTPRGLPPVPPAGHLP